MSSFSYSDYQNIVNKAQSAPVSSSVKVGYFKLADGEEALIRINCADTNDFKFAVVHAPVFGKKFEGLGSGFTPVSCLNEIGSYDTDKCPFCAAVEAGHEVIAKAAKKVYVEMLVAYKDTKTGAWAAPIPVIWERPAGFSRDLADKIKNYGDLRETIFKITRVGAGKDTRYTLDFIPVFNRTEIIPMDFSAFDNFNIAKHSYWEKSAEDMSTFINTGAFPEYIKETPAPVQSVPAAQPVPATVTPTVTHTTYVPPVTPAPAPAPVTSTPVVEQPAATPAAQPAEDSRFSGFSSYDKWAF